MKFINPKIIIIFIFIFIQSLFSSNLLAFANSGQNNVMYEVDIPFFTKVKDFTRGGALITFRKKYYMLTQNNDVSVKLKLNYLHQLKQNNVENAYKHAHTAARMTYLYGKKTTLKLAYFKEVKYYDKEIKNFGGKIPAFLDTNCDLWNDEMGVKYALVGKQNKESYKKVLDRIFDNLISEHSDFIVDYQNDKRRWNESANEYNIKDIIKEKSKSLKYD